MEFTGEHSAFWGLGENKYPDSEEGTFLQHCWRPSAGTVPLSVFLGWSEKGKGLAQQFWSCYRAVAGLCSNLRHEGKAILKSGNKIWAASGLCNIKSLCYLSERAWRGTANYQCFQEQQDLFLYGHRGHGFIPFKCDISMFGVLWEDSISEALELNRST